MPFPFSKSALFWWSACVVWCLLVFWLSVSSSPPRVPLPLFGWDKLQHGTAYALLTLFAGQSLRYLRPGLRYPWLVAALFALAFGTFMEYLQFAMRRGRMAEAGDLVADALGIGLVCLGAFLGRRLTSKGAADR